MNEQDAQNLAQVVDIQMDRLTDLQEEKKALAFALGVAMAYGRAQHAKAQRLEGELSAVVGDNALLRDDLAAARTVLRGYKTLVP